MCCAVASIVIMNFCQKNGEKCHVIFSMHMNGWTRLKQREKRILGSETYVWQHMEPYWRLFSTAVHFFPYALKQSICSCHFATDTFLCILKLHFDFSTQNMPISTTLLRTYAFFCMLMHSNVNSVMFDVGHAGPLPHDFCVVYKFCFVVVAVVAVVAIDACFLSLPRLRRF